MIAERTKVHRVELDCKVVGRSIAAARRCRKWTQKDLAEAMGRSLGCIVGWENGLRLPQTRYLGTLANLLRRSLDHLLLQRKRGAGAAHVGDADSIVPRATPLGGLVDSGNATARHAVANETS